MELNTLKELLTKKVNECGYDLVSLSLERRQGDLVLALIVDRVKEIDMSNSEDKYPTRSRTSYYLNTIICQTIGPVVRIKNQIIIKSRCVDTKQQHQHHTTISIEIHNH